MVDESSRRLPEAFALRRCIGLNSNFRRCGRQGSWRLFCGDHRYQPIAVLIFVVFTVVAGTASIQSAWFPNFLNRHSVPTKPGTFPLVRGTIIAAHYPSGELFAVEPRTGALRLLSSRLGNISGLAIRPNGEIIVLDNEIQQKFSLIIGVNPETGHHRTIGAYLWPSTAQQALALESASSAIVALDGALERVDLNSGQITAIATNELLRGASGVARMPSVDLLVTVIPDKIVRVNPTDGATAILSQGGLLWHPRSPIIQNSHSILVGTAGPNAGKDAGVLRVDLVSGAQEFVATGPFTTVAGLAIESGGSILVADNGSGAPGDGFLARLDPETRRVSILVSAETSSWKFLNGRSLALFPGVSPQ